MPAVIAHRRPDYVVLTSLHYARSYQSGRECRHVEHAAQACSLRLVQRLAES